MDFTGDGAPKSGTTSVAELKGVGPKKSQVLARYGIFTLNDLIEHVPRFKAADEAFLAQLKNTALVEVSSVLETPAHTWYAQYCHIIRHGKTIMGKIGNFVILPYQLGVWVFWIENGVMLKNCVSLQHILLVEKMWISVDLVSEDSDDESCPPIAAELPCFELTAALETGQRQTYALQALLHEVSGIYELGKGVHRDGLADLT